MNPPFFSVIIPTFNRRDTVCQVIDRLTQQQSVPGGFEVIVVSDGSTDGTGDMLRGLSTPFSLRVVEQENEGASRARNAGARLAVGAYLAFTEDDVQPATDWLAQAYALLLNKNLDVLEGRTEYAEGGGSVRRFEPPGIPSFIPCNLFIRKECFTAVGGYEGAFFDRKAGIYFREDADLGFRLLDKGFSMYIAPDVRVAHPQQFGSLHAAMRHARRYQFDPLLYKRHPRRYRDLIEVKRIAGFSIHRPQHGVALIAGVAALITVGAAAVGSWAAMVGALTVMLGCGAVFRFKYQGRQAFSMNGIPTTLAFTIVPFIYLGALLRGCARYRTIGVLW